MADYTGFAVTPDFSEQRQGFVRRSQYPHFRTIMTTGKKYENSYSLEIKPGGNCQVYCAADAGGALVSVYVWPPEAGYIYMQIYDPDTKETVATAGASTGSGAWEKIEASFTAEKKVYIVKLMNPVSADGDKRAYFDNIALE
jgi:hypothetical protein